MSSNRNTVVRSLHDVGAAAWFGGSLAGAIALNGASQDVADPKDRARVAADGWARWSPLAATAIGAHLIGGAGLLLANRRRVVGQSGTRANSAVKTVLTAAALAATAYSGLLGTRLAKDADGVPVEGGTEPTDATPEGVAKTQQQLRALQWAIPALTGGLIVLGAQQGEQQRPGEIVKGVAKRAGRSARQKAGL